MKFWVLTVSFALLAGQAIAKDCSYEKFRTQFLSEQLLYDFRHAGLGKLVSQSTDEKSNEVVKTILLKDSGVVGTMEFQKDAREQAMHLVLRDLRGRNLLSVVEEKRGVSRTEVNFYSDLGRIQDRPFLSVFHYQAGATYHYVGLQDKGIAVFYSVFRDAWSAAKEAILSEATPSYYQFKSPRENFQFRVKTHPDLMPYAENLRISEVGNHFQVRGVVPSNYAFNLVLSLAQEQLGINTDVDLIIDQRIQVAEPLPPTCRY